MQFFDLLVEGQKKLRDLLKQENELLKKNDRLKMSQGDNQLEQLNPDTMELVNYEQKNDENYGQQIIINSTFKITCPAYFSLFFEDCYLLLIILFKNSITGRLNVCSGA